MRGRRLIRLFALGAGGLISVLVLLVAAALLLVNTGGGSRLVLERALPPVDRAIAGDLDVGRLSLGLDRLVLLDVKLRDPGGELVAAIDRVEIEFSPLSLLRRRVDLHAVVIDGPRLWLVRDERGLNLARALAPVSPPGSEPEGGPPEAE